MISKNKTQSTFQKLLKSFLYLSIWNTVLKLVLCRYVIYGDKSRFKLSSKAIIHNALINVVSGNITIEGGVFFGHNVCLLTGSHDYTKFGRERMMPVKSGRNIIIKKGAWLATNVTILGPCVIGENAVVAAGSVVQNDVPPYTVVAGVPARVIKNIQKHPGKNER